MQRKNFRKFQSNPIYNRKRAYDTLGDESKRNAYDSYGMTGDEQDQLKQQGGFGGFGGFGGKSIYLNRYQYKVFMQMDLKMLILMISSTKSF